MRIVEMCNGQYAILTNRFPKRFADLKLDGINWNTNDEFFKDCLGTLEEVNNYVGARKIKRVL